MSDSLVVKSYKTELKTYETDEGVFTLRPPYAYITDQFTELLAELNDATKPKEDTGDVKTKKGKAKNETVKLADFLKMSKNPETTKRILDVMVKMVHLVLKEEKKGTLKNITTETLRMDFFEQVFNDFFQGFGKFQNFQKT
jgi:hypothetical protein